MDRNKLRKQLGLMLGEGMVDVEADREHIDMAIDLALDRARQRSDGTLIEAAVFLTVQPNIQIYTLPNEIQEVRRICRRGFGFGSGGPSTTFDPMSASLTNYYMLEMGQSGGIATWDFFSQYKETLGRMFGTDIEFHWNNVTKQLTMVRKFNGPEEIMIYSYQARPEQEILMDAYLGPWIRSYALANLKLILGEARSKFLSGLPGAGGAITLNGAELKNEGKSEIEKLDRELELHITSSTGYSFIIG